MKKKSFMLRNERVNEHIRFKYRNLIEKRYRNEWMEEKHEHWEVCKV